MEIERTGKGERECAEVASDGDGRRGLKPRLCTYVQYCICTTVVTPTQVGRFVYNQQPTPVYKQVAQ